MALNRDQILSAKDIKSELVDVPEWGEGAQVRVGMMSGTARDAWEASLIDGEGKPVLRNMRANLCAASIVGDDGKALFSITDVEQLGEKNSQVLDRIAQVARRINKLDLPHVEEAKGN